MPRSRPGWPSGPTGGARATTWSGPWNAPSFRAAIDLVDAAADAAEAADHHPDIDIRWRRVTFRLTTKAADGITFRDLAMAATIDDLVSGGTAGLESPGS